MSAPSLINTIGKQSWLSKFLKPLAGWYSDAAGYRKMGLR